MTSTPKALDQQRARRKANVAAGLTFDGRPRKNYLWPELDGLPPLQRMNERIRICTLRRRRSGDQGGISFVLEAKPVNPAAWREENKILRAQIDLVAEGIAEVFCELPYKVQARCVVLAENLSKIRKGIRI
jgi:hypothetical protein